MRLIFYRIDILSVHAKLFSTKGWHSLFHFQITITIWFWFHVIVCFYLFHLLFPFVWCRGWWQWPRDWEDTCNTNWTHCWNCSSYCVPVFLGKTVQQWKRYQLFFFFFFFIPNPIPLCLLPFPTRHLWQKLKFLLLFSQVVNEMLFVDSWLSPKFLSFSWIFVFCFSVFFFFFFFFFLNFKFLVPNHSSSLPTSFFSFSFIDRKDVYW